MSKEKRKNLYINTEGLDKSGKSTLLNQINGYFNSKFFTVAEELEIGKESPFDLSRAIRSYLSFSSEELVIDKELYNKMAGILFTANRFRLEAYVKSQTTVKHLIMGRGIVSTLVYAEIDDLHYNNLIKEINLTKQLITQPDIIFYLDIDMNTYINRLGNNYSELESYEADIHSFNKYKARYAKYLDVMEKSGVQVIKLDGRDKPEIIYNNFVIEIIKARPDLNNKNSIYFI